MLKICLVYWKSGPHYAYKCYAYRKHVCLERSMIFFPSKLYGKLREFKLFRIVAVFSWDRWVSQLASTHVNILCMLAK